MAGLVKTTPVLKIERFGPHPYRPAPFLIEMPYRGRDKNARYQRRLKCWNITGGYCWHCREPLRFGAKNDGYGYPFELDHLIPRGLPGSEDHENIVPACQSCNASKRDRLDWDVTQHSGWRAA